MILHKMIYTTSQQTDSNQMTFNDIVLEISECHEFNRQSSLAMTVQSVTSTNNAPSYVHFANEAWRIFHLSTSIQSGPKSLEVATWPQASKYAGNNEDKLDSSILDLRKRQSESTLEDGLWATDKLEDFVCQIHTPCQSQALCEAFTIGFPDVQCSCHAHIYSLGHRRNKPNGRCWDSGVPFSVNDLLPRDDGSGELWTPTSACFCNASYASDACCGVQGGLVWESPGLALFDSTLDGDL